MRDYARVCGDKVLARFSASSILEPAEIVNTTYELGQSSFTVAISRMSDVWGFAGKAELLHQFRTRFASRIGTDNKVNWLRVVAQSLSGEDVQVALPLLAAFQLVQTQSAECERFALVTQLKQALGEHISAEVFEQYLQVLGVRPTEELRSSGFFERCLDVLLEKERREGTIVSGWQHGFHLIMRLRAVRSDRAKKGQSTPGCSVSPALESRATRKALRNDEAMIETVDEDVVDNADIHQLLSPPKRKKQGIKM